MPHKAPLFAITASLLFASPVVAAKSDDTPDPELTVVYVSAADLDLSLSTDREKLIKRSLEQARRDCSARIDRSSPCHVDFVVVDGGKPKWLKWTFREYLARHR